MSTATKTRRPVVKLTEAEYRALALRAHEAGVAASEAIRPTPMTVYTPKDPFAAPSGNGLLADADLSKPVYVESEGACGFGWVEVRPVNGGIGKWFKQQGRTYGYYSEYDRSFHVRSPLRTQSYERNVAYARAYAEVLQAAGIDAYGTGRLD